MAPDLNHSTVESKGETVNYTADENERLSDAVIAALRRASGAASSPPQGDDGQNVELLDPLFETLDPDALDTLFSPTGVSSQTTGTVKFTHAGYQVTASSTGEITVSTGHPRSD